MIRALADSYQYVEPMKAARIVQLHDEVIGLAARDFETGDPIQVLLAHHARNYARQIMHLLGSLTIRGTDQQVVGFVPALTEQLKEE